MIPSITGVRLSGAATRAELPLLVLGPDPGTTALSLWSEVASHLGGVFDVLAWDLPGHGYNRGVPEEGFTIGELAAGVLQVVDDVLEQRGELGAPFAYAGLSAGATVGLQLLLDHPHRVRTLVVLGDPLLPAIAATTADIGSADQAGYDLVLAALTEHDAGDRADQLDEHRASGRLVVLSRDAEHEAFTGEPARVAWALRHHVLGETPPADPAELTAAFERVDLAATWERPGLERRTRHLVALAVLALDDDLDLFRGAVRAAVGDGVTPDEVFECLVQVAAHGDVAAARTAVRAAQATIRGDAG